MVKQTFLAAVLALTFIGGAALADDDKKAGLYKVDVEGTLEVGKDGKLILKIAPAKEGYKFNKEYPTKVKVTSGDKVTFSKATYKQADGDVETKDKVGYVTLGARGKSAGTETITVEASFSICDKKVCHVLRKRKVPVAVTVR